MAIDGTSVEDVIAAVSTVFPYENESWRRSRVPDFAVLAEVLRALRVTGDAREATFAFETPHGNRIERKLTAGAEVASWQTAPIAMTARNPNAYFWAEYLPASRTIFLKYNRCQNDPAKSFAAFIAELFASVGAKPVEKLVIDMRDNPGGNSSVFAPAISAIQARPSINRADRLFVLIGRRTFSSALINSMQLDAQTNATLVGEPTGGKPNAYGEILSLTLPASRLTVWYSTRYFELVRGSDPPSLVPEMPVAPSAASFFDGVDNVFQAVVTPVPKRRATTSPPR